MGLYVFLDRRWTWSFQTRQEEGRRDVCDTTGVEDPVGPRRPVPEAPPRTGPEPEGPPSHRPTSTKVSRCLSDFPFLHLCHSDPVRTSPTTYLPERPVSTVRRGCYRTGTTSP